MTRQRDDNHSVHNGTATTRLAAVTMCVSLGCVTSAAHAANWEFLPRISVGAFTDDNYAMAPSTEPQIDVVGAQIDADFALRASTQLTEFALIPRLESTVIPDDEEWESNDYYLGLDWSHRQQRFTAALRADYSDETTVKSELPSSEDDGDLGDPDQGDAGFITVDNRRQRSRVRPRATFAITERSELLADLGYADADYDRVDPGTTEGYSETDASLGYAFRVSRTSTLSIRGLASRYERKEDSVETDSYGIRAEWTSRPSEVSRWYMRVGAEEVDVPESLQTTAASTTETGFEGGVGADWKFQVTKLFIDATASVEPNSSGRLIERETLRVKLTRQFGPRSYGWIRARATRDTALRDDLDTFRDRDYATGTLGFEWRLTREFSLIGEYDFKWQEREDDLSDATSNAFLLSIVYERRRAE
jgi:hypothetical protein